MTIIANTYTAYDARGIREELSDVIYRISPEETPFISNVGKGGTVDNTYFEWQNDALAAATTNNAQLDGNDYTAFPAAVPTTRLGNYCQISTKQVLVSGRVDRVKKAGRKSELSYQLALRSAELKRDMESISCQNNFAAPGTVGATASTTASFETFLRTNTNRGAAGANSTLSGGTQGYPNAAPTDGTQRAFTEVILKDVAQKVWTSGGHLTMLMLGALQKQVASGFAGIAQQRRETGAKAAVIIGAADAYLSDFGTIQIVPNRFSRNRSGLFLDPEYIEIVFLRPFQQITLAKTGDAEKRLLLVDWGVKVNHEAAHGIAADLT
jgi:hypothetical protein